MKFSKLKPANALEVRDYLAKQLDLTPRQREMLYDMEFPERGRYRMYVYVKDEKPSLWWRLTLPLYPVYYVLVFIFICLQWIAAGRWGVGEKFLDKFHYPWTRKLGL